MNDIIIIVCSVAISFFAILLIDNSVRKNK